MNFDKINKLYDSLLQGIDLEEIPHKSFLSFGRNLLKAYKFMSKLESDQVTPTWKARLVIIDDLAEEFLRESESRLNCPDEEGFKPSEVISLTALLQDMVFTKHELDNGIKGDEDLMDALSERLGILGDKV